MFNGRNIQDSEGDQHKSFHSPRRLISLMALGPPRPRSALPAPKSDHRSWFPGRCPTLWMDPEPMWPLGETLAGWTAARRWLFSSEETENFPPNRSKLTITLTEQSSNYRCRLQPCLPLFWDKAGREPVGREAHPSVSCVYGTRCIPPTAVRFIRTVPNRFCASA